MSYDITWHRRKETIYDYKTDSIEESVYFDEDNPRIAEMQNLHSGLCGWIDFTQKPFEIERTGLNITSNLYKMFSWAVNGDENKDWKDTLHMKRGGEIENILRIAVTRMEENPEKAEMFNSPNGWGTYPNALRFLRDLLAESMLYENYYLSINY